MEIKSAKISGQGYAVDYGDGVIWSVSVDGCGYDKVLAWLADGNTPEPEFTEAELTQQALNKSIAEAKAYLASTDWVEPYLIKHYTGLEVIEAGSNKFVIEAKRTEARAFLKEQGL